MASFAPRLPPANSDGEIDSMSGDHDNDDGNSNAQQHRSIQCCCGRAECAYLEHNNTALGGLERDLETAARLGQALLSRHETYIIESRAEHARLSEHISELEADRSSLQNANEKIVAENRDLLSKLEALNGSLANSDDEVSRLEALLLDCELEVKRLNGLVRRTEGLDGRVAEMERENLDLNSKIDESQANSKNTLVRWRQSQRKVRELEDEVRRIEAEAAHDREQHQDIVARMEKENLLERELGGAEGRLKGAAAVQSIKTNAPGSKNVVSHFVRDILQDNANLQAGIAELRELLQSSNEEVQNLREQILLHQPIHEGDDTPPAQQPSLDEEMASSLPSPKRLQQEVHVHHHYHAKIGKKQTTARRSNKRRAIMPGNDYTSDSSSPNTPRTRSQRYFSNTSTSFGHSQPQSYKNNRWSMQSTATSASFLSSIPSSPRSYFDRNGSLFDRMEHEEELSRPTSPESMSGMISPGLRIFKGRKAEESDLTPFEEEYEGGRASPVFEEENAEGRRVQLHSEDAIEEESVTKPDRKGSQEMPGQELTPKPSVMLNSNAGVEAGEMTDSTEQDLDGLQIDREKSQDGEKTSGVGTPPDAVVPESALLTLPEIRPSIRRVASHESLVSISGMDIHIAQRPTAALKLLKGNSTHFALSPSPNRKISAAEPLASVTEYTAVSTMGNEHGLSRMVTPSRVPASVEALSGIAVPKSRSSNSPAQQSRGLGRLVGGWVRGKWGVAPAKSYGDLRSVSDNSASGSIRSTPSTLEEIAEPTTSGENANTKIEVLPASPPKKIPGSNRQEGVTSVPSSVNIADLFGGRSSGVNQSGFIPGFRAALMNRRTPSEIQAQVIDEEGLREGLAEGV